MYRPNFCAECGEQIARLRWRVWTSRRFCAACDKRFRRGRIRRLSLACGALLLAGYAAGRLTRPAAPPLVIERGAVNSSPSQTLTLGTIKSSGATGADATAARERPTEPNEVVSVCGARTKRGTPCSRRVRGTGRCWQHRGRAAMLPASKLIVPE